MCFGVDLCCQHDLLSNKRTWILIFGHKLNPRYATAMLYEGIVSTLDDTTSCSCNTLYKTEPWKHLEETLQLYSGKTIKKKKRS